MVKVRRPHERYFEDLIRVDSTLVYDKGSGLYLSRLHKKNPDDFGIRPLKRNTWIVFRKRELKPAKKSAKYAWFI